jgi:hypothetical protein
MNVKRNKNFMVKYRYGIEKTIFRKIKVCKE